ncbi:MAG: alpha-hydroxy-acid oxidizing enzyme [Gammaproteobacteria bacterium]|nr:MAG: alpha-hydroxy-acid oxidizing enzyme [Gammaproteobacteria bacterium]
MSSKTLDLAPASVEDYRKLAEKRLPRAFFDYIDGAAHQELTAKKNILAFESLQLRQRILRDVSNIDTSVNLLGRALDFPLILGPVGLAGIFARRGEAQALKAANKAKIPFCLSTVSICSIEELNEVATEPFWFQLYVIRDRSYAIKLMQNAAAAGCDTLVLTVDLPVVGERYKDVRNGLSGKTNLMGSIKKAINIACHPRWLWDVAIKGKPLVFGNLVDAVPDASGLKDFKSWVDSQFDASMTWDDLGWIREHWSGNIIIKGIMDVDDAKKAVAFGADAIVVSNHGGRQLEGVAPTLDMLPEIVKAVDKKCKVIVDSGIRSGLDIVKAIALGADACIIGRAWAYAIAAKGEDGVTHVLEIMKNEMRVAMALTGVTKVSDIDADILN